MQSSKGLNFFAFLLSILIYCALVFVVASKTITTETIRKFSVDERSFVDVYLSTQAESQTPKHAKESNLNLANFNEAALKEAGQQTPSQEDDGQGLSELFENISEQTFKQEIAQLNESGINLTNITLNQSKELVLASPLNNELFQSDGEFDAFLGSFEKELQKRWVRYKANSSVQAEVSVLLDKNGKFSYKIIRPSYSRAFNAKVQAFLEDLKQVQFQKPPKDMLIKTYLVDKIK